MKHYKPYLIAYAVFLACLFASPYLYSFFDVHVSDAYEHYERDRNDWEKKNGTEIAFISYPEWIQKDLDKDRDFFQAFGEECAYAFDPWFEPTHFEREIGKEE